MKEKWCTEPSRVISFIILKTKLKIRLSASIFVTVSELTFDSLDKIYTYARDGIYQGYFNNIDKNILSTFNLFLFCFSVHASSLDLL